MSKPLELTIYPPRGKQPLPFDPDWQGWDAWREWKRLYDREFQQRRDTRLTTAELAAEYWAMIAHFNKVQWAELASGEPVKESIWDTLARRNAAMYRFATSPHYFEADQ